MYGNLYEVEYQESICSSKVKVCVTFSSEGKSEEVCSGTYKGMYVAQNVANNAINRHRKNRNDVVKQNEK